jgi:hypothetical protein
MMMLTGENRSTGRYAFTSLWAFVVQRERTLRYSSTLFVISALEGVGGQRHVPVALLREGDMVPTTQQAGWRTGLLRMGSGKEIETILYTGTNSTETHEHILES